MRSPSAVLDLPGSHRHSTADKHPWLSHNPGPKNGGITKVEPLSFRNRGNAACASDPENARAMGRHERRAMRAVRPRALRAL